MPADKMSSKSLMPVAEVRKGFSEARRVLFIQNGKPMVITLEQARRQQLTMKPQR